MGALAYYVSHAEAKYYQPSNITFGIMPPLAQPPRGGRGRRHGGPGKKELRNKALSERALAALDGWLGEIEPVGVGA
jgi:methylenetetrahydrofolate--tRNA-(uracil-5-)-methyltransferase